MHVLPSERLFSVLSCTTIKQMMPPFPTDRLASYKSLDLIIMVLPSDDPYPATIC